MPKTVNGRQWLPNMLLSVGRGYQAVVISFTVLLSFCPLAMGSMYALVVGNGSKVVSNGSKVVGNQWLVMDPN